MPGWLFSWFLLLVLMGVGWPAIQLRKPAMDLRMSTMRTRAPLCQPYAGRLCDRPRTSCLCIERRLRRRGQASARWRARADFSLLSGRCARKWRCCIAQNSIWRLEAQANARAHCRDRLRPGSGRGRPGAKNQNSTAHLLSGRRSATPSFGASFGTLVWWCIVSDSGVQ